MQKEVSFPLKSIRSLMPSSAVDVQNGGKEGLPRKQSHELWRTMGQEAIGRKSGG